MTDDGAGDDEAEDRRMLAWSLDDGPGFVSSFLRRLSQRPAAGPIATILLDQLLVASYVGTDS